MSETKTEKINRLRIEISMRQLELRYLVLGDPRQVVGGVPSETLNVVTPEGGWKSFNEQKRDPKDTQSAFSVLKDTFFNG